MVEVRRGDCKVCGKCCQLFPIDNKMPISRFTFQAPYLENFGEMENLITDGKDVVYSHFIKAKCKYLQPDGKCGNHKNRPQICRDYPIESSNPLYQYLKAQGVECGYEFITIREGTEKLP